MGNFSLFVRCYAALYWCWFCCYGNNNVPFSGTVQLIQALDFGFVFYFNSFFCFPNTHFFPRVCHSICFDYFRYANKIIQTLVCLTSSPTIIVAIVAAVIFYHLQCAVYKYRYPIYCLSLVTNLLSVLHRTASFSLSLYPDNGVDDDDDSNNRMQ